MFVAPGGLISIVSIITKSLMAMPNTSLSLFIVNFVGVLKNSQRLNSPRIFFVSLIPLFPSLHGQRGCGASEN